MKKCILIFYLLLLGSAIGAADQEFEQKLAAIMNRPEFQHATFGIHILSLKDRKDVYSLNANKFFVPASTTKIITSGSALEILGPDYRFHTRMYRTGAVTADGALQGDLILVASGDPNLSGRVTDKDTLLFENQDHSYGGEFSRGVSKDALFVIHKFAKQVAKSGIKRVSGRLIVDASLFPQGDRELGTDVVLSPIVVNDNVVDVLITPGKKEGEATSIQISPETSYVRFINKAVTGKTGSNTDYNWTEDTEKSDGSRTVALTGTFAAGGPTVMSSYAVPDPTRYAEFVLTEALREEGILVNPRLKEDQPDFKSLSGFYKSEYQLAEHISPPMTEEIKIILKVSQNLHASMMPYLFSSLIAKKEVPQSGFELMLKSLEKMGLKHEGASQEDGAGGSANFTPEFMTGYLAYWADHKNSQIFRDALPVLGKDGTLFDIQMNSPAAGHVFAKTGTYGRSDLLHKGLMVDSKALAGYTTSRSGNSLAFAIFVNHVLVSSKPYAIRDIVGQAVGEIAALAYEHL